MQTHIASKMTTAHPSYSSMHALIASYKLRPLVLRVLLTHADALIAGSAPLRVHLDGKVTYAPGDIDIWVKKSTKISPLIEYITDNGYKLTSAVISSPTTYMSEYIDEIQTYTLDEDSTKKIQVVVITCEPLYYITTQLDISATATYWNPATDTIVPADEYLQRLEIYVTNHYCDILAGPDSGRRKKLLGRLDMYGSRGFTVIELPK